MTINHNTSKTSTDNAYENLANAIILQAVKDYRGILRKIKKHPFDRLVLSEKRRLERFFRSQWFGMLTNIDPELLMLKLNQEVECK